MAVLQLLIEHWSQMIDDWVIDLALQSGHLPIPVLLGLDCKKTRTLRFLLNTK